MTAIHQFDVTFLWRAIVIPNACTSSRKLSAAARIFRISMVAAVFVIMVWTPEPSVAFQLIDPPKIQSESAARVVKQFLTTDWKRDFENRDNANRTFTSTGAVDPAVSIAFVLNRVQHNRMREALDVAHQLTRRTPELIDGWVLKSWLNALLDNYERSLIDLRSLKKQVDAQPNLTEAQKSAVYRRVGKLIGYMQGPVSDKVDPDLLQQTLMLIANGCSPEELKAFNASRDSVLARYEELLKSQNEKAKLELERQEVKDQNLEVTLNDQNQLLEQTMGQLVTEEERIRLEGERQIAALADQLSPLEQQLVSVSNSIAAVQQDLQFLYIDLTNALAAPPRFRVTPVFITNQIRLREFDLLNLQADRDSIYNQLELIRSQIIRTRNGFNAQLTQVQRQFKQASNSKRRNLIKLGKIAAGPEIADGKKGAMTSRLTALSNYDNLSVELYRQQMLDRLPDR